jgi:hypothetical protein
MPFAAGSYPVLLEIGAYWPLTGRPHKMNLVPHIGPLAALIAGVLILLIPRLLNYIVAIYLIVIGVLGLFGGR